MKRKKNKEQQKCSFVVVMHDEKWKLRIVIKKYAFDEMIFKAHTSYTQELIIPITTD